MSIWYVESPRGRSNELQWMISSKIACSASFTDENDKRAAFSIGDANVYAGKDISVQSRVMRLLRLLNHLCSEFARVFLRRSITDIFNSIQTTEAWKSQSGIENTDRRSRQCLFKTQSKRSFETNLKMKIKSSSRQKFPSFFTGIMQTMSWKLSKYFH